ncbi:TDP-N-acetylfucosamine:lipid II N-acetylfucosaminyltransferase [Aeromonas bivalvium]|uniref:TDP-N-acetylfucosamine:lipid II N-acetylfucosaminyltransferase n=1 Tax=Aeromonas bivalvium TaxID=440079 RepID=UPI00370B7DA2
MMKIAHIATDEKFIENAVDIFEASYPEQNTFYITTPKPWSFIKEKKIYRQLSKKKWLKLLFIQRDELKSYDVIVLHSLPSVWLIPMVMLKQNYIWLGWGFDYYSRSFNAGLIADRLILPDTKERIKELVNDTDSANCRTDLFSHLIKSLFKSIVFSKFFYQLAMRNLKIFSPVLPQEYDLVKQTYGLGKKTKYSPWNYGILEKHIIKNMKLNEISTANAILLGNSATATNNHFEAIDIIAKSGTSRKVILPLSYGDKNYAELVKEYIKNNPEIVGQCQVLDTFIPLAEYNSIMNDCGFVIMNHVRQQALGNIVAMMYRGAKIFLREESVLYKHFKSLNAHIHSVQELELDSTLLDQHLTCQQIDDNRCILQAAWSEDVILKRTKALVESAMS